MRITQPAVVLGTVDWLQMIRAGQAFALDNTLTAVAAQYSHNQIYNPVGSGVTIVVHKLYIKTGAATIVNIAFYDTQMASDNSTGFNLLSGSAVSVGIRRSETGVTLRGTRFISIYSPGNVFLEPIGPWVCELGPGEGVVIVPTTVNISNQSGYEWVELVN